MENAENGKLVRVIEIEPVKISCAECNEFVCEAVEEPATGIEIYCSYCYSTIKDKRDEFEHIIEQIKDLSDGGTGL